MALTDKLVAIANAIRAKTGKTGTLSLERMATEISGIKTGITPIGTLLIVENGEHDVTEFAGVNVNVPSSGITPSGSINITANGTHNVTNYASAVVNVPTPEPICVVRTVTVSADVTGAKNHQLLSGDEFIKKHYADEGFSATLLPITAITAAANVVTFNHQGNRNICASGISRTGVGIRCSSTSANSVVHFTTAINGKGYTQHMRVDSTGALYQYLHTDYILKAGTYQIILTCTT